MESDKSLPMLHINKLTSSMRLFQRKLVGAYHNYFQLVASLGQTYNKF